MRGWLLTKGEAGFAASLTDIDPASLPSGEVLVRVDFSSLNYKDGLALTGVPGVVRSYPMVPGIDLAGTVVESSSTDFSPGDEVVAIGAGLGERLWGGYAELARVPADALVPRPPEFTARQAMAIGTAGFTAMQCVDALERHGMRPGGRDVVVSGAAGGVGSAAIALLAGKGYRVAASTGRPEESGYLRSLGAAQIISREELPAPSKRPMDSERWAGAVDTVGGDTLAGILRSLSAQSAAACCGLAGGAELHTTVYPLILRGVSLLGVNSVDISNAERRRIWRLLADYMDRDLLDSMTSEISLEQAESAARQILAGRVRGRTVVRIR
jgi:acrylyl-CoA reductase (NADPH)